MTILTPLSYLSAEDVHSDVEEYLLEGVPFTGGTLDCYLCQRIQEASNSLVSRWTFCKGRERGGVLLER
jgi:hypothetical protein